MTAPYRWPIGWVSGAVAALALGCLGASDHDDPLEEERAGPFPDDGEMEVLDACEGTRTDDARFGRALQALRNEVAEEHVPGAAIAVVWGGEVRHVGVIGSRRKGCAPVTPHTTFRAGALTEIVTASALMAGPLGEKLDGPIAQLVPEFEAVGISAAPVTLRHALTHGTGWAGDLSLGSCPSLEEWRTSGTRARAFAPPGAIYQANPANYALVGLALERSTGKSFEHVVWQRVLDPLRMTWSTFNPVTAARREPADGHDMNGRAVPIGALDCGVERPGLGLMTTIDDLADFLALLDRGGDGLLSAEDVEEIGGTTAPSFYPSRVAGFGLERFRPTPEQPEILLAQGASQGFAQAMLLVPEYRFGVVVLENAEHGWPAEVAYETARIFLGIEPRPRFTPGVAHLGGLTGTYRALLGEWPAPFGAPPWSRRRLLQVARVQTTLLGRIDGGRIFVLSPVIDRDVLAARIDGELHRFRFWRSGEKHRALMVSFRSASDGPPFVRLPE